MKNTAEVDCFKSIKNKVPIARAKHQRKAKTMVKLETVGQEHAN